MSTNGEFFYTLGRVADCNPAPIPIVAVGTDSLGRTRREFLHPIFWIRESASRAVLKHGGEEVQEGSHFNDFYGHLTSIDAAVEDAITMCGRYVITRESSLIVEVETTISDTPAMSIEQEPGKKLKYRGTPHDWHFGPEGTKRIEEVVVVEKLIVWSNRAGTIDDAWAKMYRLSDRVSVNVVMQKIRKLQWR